MAIYKKLLELQKTVKGLGKDTKGFNYSYVSGSKVLSYLRPKMDELGIILKQEIVEITNVRQDYADKYGKTKSEILTTCNMKFTWVDCETGETDVNMFAANGQNDWEKGLGSALTYGERYFLLKYFHIATDEDDVDARQEEPQKAPQKTTEPQKAPPKKEVTKEEDKPKLTEEEKVERVVSAIIKISAEKNLVADEVELSKKTSVELLKIYDDIK